MDQLEVPLDRQPQIAQQCPAGAQGAGVHVAQRHRLALEPQQVGDGAGVRILLANDELLHIGPKRRYRPQGAVGPGLGEGTGARPRVIGHQTLQDREIHLAVSQQAHILRRAGGGNGGEPDAVLLLQGHLDQGRQCHADGIVGAPGAGGGEQVASLLGPCGRVGEERADEAEEDDETPRRDLALLPLSAFPPGSTAILRCREVGCQALARRAGLALAQAISAGISRVD